MLKSGGGVNSVHVHVLYSIVTSLNKFRYTIHKIVMISPFPVLLFLVLCLLGQQMVLLI